MQYYSDKINGKQPKNIDDIPHNAWGGIVATIDSLIASGAFGERFPYICDNGGGGETIGTNVAAFDLAMKAEIPDIEYPFVTEKTNEDSFSPVTIPFVPNFLTVLDLVQFVYEHVAKPVKAYYHDFYRHHHLNFDREQGRQEFLNNINRIFSRNQISYELQKDGTIIRLAPEVLAEELITSKFQTKDSPLNQMLSDARLKFLNPDIKVRKESLERLWDAWERIKTLLDSDKKKSMSQLLDLSADEPNLREILEIEAKSLTTIGNTFQIRHSELGQVEINRSTQIDYMFHRLFCFIQLILKSMA